jgi:hypothetical protein
MAWPADNASTCITTLPLPRCAFWPLPASRCIGGACRHALRGLEDCYVLNPKAAKASVFAGWKDMDAYMRENKIEGTPSVLGKAEPKPERTDRNNDIETEPRDPAASRNRS